MQLSASSDSSNEWRVSTQEMGTRKAKPRDFLALVNTGTQNKMHKGAIKFLILPTGVMMTDLRAFSRSELFQHWGSYSFSSA